VSEFDGDVCEPDDGWDLDLVQPPAPKPAPKPPEPAWHGPAPAPQASWKFGDPGFGGTDAKPGKDTKAPVFAGGDAKVAAAAQEMRVGLAQLDNLNNKVLPALRSAAYQGATNMAHLEAKSGVTRIKNALAAADKLVPHAVGQFDNSPIANDRYKLRSGLNEVEDKIYYVMRDLTARWEYQKRVAEEKAKVAKLPKDPPPKPGAHFTKHAAVPPVLDFGKIAPGSHATETWTIYNLVNKPAGITVSYTGDPAIQLLEKPTALNPAGQQSQNGIKLRFDSKSHGTHRGTLTIRYDWQYEVPDPETFTVQVVAHSMMPHEHTADEIAEQAKRTRDDQVAHKQQESDAAKQRRELEEFIKKHPRIETDDFRNAVEKLQIQARRLNAKQQAGITFAENQVGKFKRRLPPKAQSLWMEAAMLALDIASAGIAGRIAKRLELDMIAAKVIFREDLGGGVTGAPKELAKWTNRAVISMFTDSLKEAIKGGSKRARDYVKNKPDTEGEHGKDGDADKNKDAAFEFFKEQRTMLADVGAGREDGILDASAALRPMLFNNEKGAMAALEVCRKRLSAEADGEEPADIQAKHSIDAWVRFLSENSFGEKGSPNEVHKIGDVRNYHEVKKFDGLIDISFKLGKSPMDPVIVTGARMYGVSDTVAARYADRPLMEHDVAVRAYGKGGAGTNHAEIPITVVRHSDGRIEFKQENMGLTHDPVDYLSRKVYRRGSAAELGAKKLIEEEIMSKSLRDHGVTIKHDHDNG
jgi:hypothetical protein